MFTEKERIYFTKTELEYIDTDNLNTEENETLDKAIEILSKALEQDKHHFSEEENEILCEAMLIQESEEGSDCLMV